MVGQSDTSKPVWIGIDLAVGPDSVAVHCPQPVAGVCPACGEMDGSGCCGAIPPDRDRHVIRIRDKPRSPWK